MSDSPQPGPDQAAFLPEEAFDSAATRADPPPEKVLVVDDEQAARESVVDFLRLEGYEVSEASDGETALQMVEREHYNVVVTDLVMPRMDGLAFMKAARQFERHTEYIVMTGFASWETAVEAMKLGAADYLPKPLNFDLLRIVVARTLEKQRLAEWARQAEYYRRLAQTDGLTALYNHRFFQQLLAAEMSRAQRFKRPLSLIMLDVDRFKAYNDAYGHQAGDRALQHLARLLKRSSRNYDLIARYGGEEFVIILPETDKRLAAEVAERVRAAVAETPIEHAEASQGEYITVSLGVAGFPQDAMEKGDLVRKADRALYRAKRRGRNQVCIYEADDA